MATTHTILDTQAITLVTTQDLTIHTTPFSHHTTAPITDQAMVEAMAQ